jgi:peptide/nickel transport system permease protein
VFKRTGQLILVVWGALTIVFFVGRVLPADPALLMSGPGATEQMVETARERFGLDRPLAAQYLSYLADLARGDLGSSLATGRPVSEELAERLPASLELIFPALLLASAVSFGLGLFSAKKPGGLLDRAADALVYAGTFIPTFLLGALLLYLFYTLLPIAAAPMGRLDPAIRPPRTRTGFLVLDGILSGRPEVVFSAISHLILPAVTLAFALIPQLLRVLRAGVRTALRSEPVRAAQAAGVGKARIWRSYVLSLAAGPTLTLLAASFGYLIGGTVIVEHLYGWNGLGSLIMTGISTGDYPVVQGTVIVAAVTYGAAFFITDLAARGVDPRITGRRAARRAAPRHSGKSDGRMQ